MFVNWPLVGLVLVWLMCLGLSVCLVLELVGMRLMLVYFPEGKRAWQVPAQFAALAAFAAVIHFNPF